MAYLDSLVISNGLVISRVINSKNSPIDASMKCPINSLENRIENLGCHILFRFSPYFFIQ